MVRRYEACSIYPLDFGDGQSVEAGETFERDFEAKKDSRAPFLIRHGFMRVVEAPVVPSVPQNDEPEKEE